MNGEDFAGALAWCIVTVAVPAAVIAIAPTTNAVLSFVHAILLFYQNEEPLAERETSERFDQSQKCEAPSAVKIEKLSKRKSNPRLRRELFASENPRRRNARNQP